MSIEYLNVNLVPRVSLSPPPQSETRLTDAVDNQLMNKFIRPNFGGGLTLKNFIS